MVMGCYMQVQCHRGFSDLFKVCTLCCASDSSKNRCIFFPHQSTLKNAKWLSENTFNVNTGWSHLVFPNTLKFCWEWSYKLCTPFFSQFLSFSLANQFNQIERRKINPKPFWALQGFDPDSDWVTSGVLMSLAQVTSGFSCRCSSCSQPQILSMEKVSLKVVLCFIHRTTLSETFSVSSIMPPTLIILPASAAWKKNLKMMLPLPCFTVRMV